MLLIGLLMSEVTIADGGGYAGHGFSGGGHSGGRYSGGWNRGGRVGIYLGAPIGFSYGYNPYSYYRAPYYGAPYYGAPYYGGGYSYPPAYYPYAPTFYPLAQPAPATYVERSNEPQIGTQEAPSNSPQNAQGAWWYYCVDAKAYYPYVNQCPGGWLRVAPQPAPDSSDQPSLNDSPAP